MSLAEAYERIAAGVAAEDALAEFADSFYLAPSAQARAAMLAREPALIGQPKLDTLAGAVAEYLAHDLKLDSVPDWAFRPVRYLDRPWHTTFSTDDAMREYLSFASPAEFASRNIFTEERPLRRARRPQTDVARVSVDPA